MAEFNAIQASGARGELTPKLHGRVDTEHYQLGFQTLLNFHVLRHGIIRKRSGTRFVGEVKSSTDMTRLMPFKFNTLQAYALEFGNLYYRIWTRDGSVESGGSPVEVVTPYTTADLFSIHHAQSDSADILYTAHQAYSPYEIRRITDTTWEATPRVFQDGPFQVELRTAYATLTITGTGNIVPKMTANNLPSGVAADSSASGTAYLAFDRDPDTSMDLVGGKGWISYTPTSAKVAVGYVMRAVDENTPTDWAFEGYDGANWIPLDSRRAEIGWRAGEERFFDFINTTAYDAYRLNWTSKGGVIGSDTKIAELRITESAATMSALPVSASSTTGINNDTGFQASDVGRQLRILGPDGLWRWLTIESRSSTTAVTVKLNGASLPDTPSTISRWRIGSWSDQSGWPCCLAFYESRLWYGGSTAEPQTIWGSVTNGFDDHGISDPLVTDDAMSFRLPGGDFIQWLAESADLIVGTTGAFQSVGTGNGDPFTALNFRKRKDEETPVNSVQPSSANGRIFTSDFYSSKMLEISYAAEFGKYSSSERSILADHLYRDGVTETAYTASPDPILWGVRTGGGLVPMTYEPDQQIAGVSDFQIAGTDAAVESCTSIPGVAGDELWMIVKRTINGVTKRYIERMIEPFEDQVKEDGVFLDSSLTYEGAATGTISGLDHLEGEAVHALVNGQVVGPMTVVSGAVTLPDELTGTKIHVGLLFEARAKTMRFAAQGQQGSVLGEKKPVNSVKLDVLEADKSTKIGQPGADYELIEHRTQDDLFDEGTQLITGAFYTPVDSSSDAEAVMEVLSDTPTPCTVRAIIIGVDAR